ncbi:1-deoxy-D-xylulose-5-phosphate reductoisomerase [Marispirochaeta sp.]|uniref:1-deoxy-D-xylulose-5-phosphate reductoisomerase n=1 Tax=Marispirochaeta sp. TaxID=2038653 RepID=UPI0029C6BFA3|nr:1-deoxy-D-xylulose-5-phosphate reductoisomerase [Marispirochaeta sp.]
MKTKRVILLGATGSIGTSTLDVISSFPDRFRIVGLSAHTNTDQLLQIARKHPEAKTALSGISKADGAEEIDIFGKNAAVELIDSVQADIVVNGIMGSGGLAPSASAISAGMDLALANKETIVMAGDLLLPEARNKGVNVLPVDSEHAAVFQLLKNRPHSEISDIILTASGGAFRTTPLEQLDNVSVQEALNHPTWKMGVKITIDSASMANKGLEVIEAERFFDMNTDKVSVLIHPQSYVHSLVRTCDGILYAQISAPDMKNPIINALSFPETLVSNFAPLDLTGKSLDFYEPDFRRYPMLKLAFQASRKSASYPTAYNAANEAAVDAFIHNRISYLQIPEIVETVLQQDWSEAPIDLQGVFDVDSRVRSAAEKLLAV